MLRGLLSNRAILAGLIFFILVVGGSLLYNWQVQHTTEAEFARTDAILQPLKNKGEMYTAEDTSDTSTVNFEHLETPLEVSDDAQISDDTDAVPMDDTDDMALVDVFLPDETMEEENTEGNFPEVPSDFPENLTPVWLDFPHYQKGDMYDHEMIYRVLIKLWNQGERGFVNGVFRDSNSKVYPLYPDVLYVRWDEEEIGGPDGTRTVRVPKSILGTHDRAFTPEEMLSGKIEELYPNIKFIETETAGYDPETFLTDNEK